MPESVPIPLETAISDGVNCLIIIVLSICTLIGILDFVGFLPHSIRNWILRNRADDTLEVLKHLGIDVERYRRHNQVLQYPKTIEAHEIEEVTKNILEAHKDQKKVVVGKTRKTELPFYYDLIGASCDPHNARYFAEILSSFWLSNLENTDRIKESDFDFVVTPKGGSPILGYEFAALIDKPFVLHEEKKRLLLEGDMRSCFDCATVPSAGEVALIVDDSTTGGSMIINTVEDLRKHGYEVHTCLVIFEPKGKNAKERLSAAGVQLVSILETHSKN